MQPPPPATICLQALHCSHQRVLPQRACRRGRIFAASVWRRWRALTTATRRRSWEWSWWRWRALRVRLGTRAGYRAGCYAVLCCVGLCCAGHARYGIGRAAGLPMLVTCGAV